MSELKCPPLFLDEENGILRGKVLAQGFTVSQIVGPGLFYPNTLLHQSTQDN